MNRRTVVPAAVLVLAAALGVTPPADAAGAGTQASCAVYPGSVLANGSQASGGVTVGYPPTTIGVPGVTAGVFPAGAVRLSTTFTSDPHSRGAVNDGWVVEGDALYYRSYWIDEQGQIDPEWPNETQRIGGGWANFTALETSRFATGVAAERTTAYGLRSDGTLFRWSVSRASWRATGSATGFAAVKSMALISKTATYDTFLANTRGGALYTIRIPVTAAMKPIVTAVRTTTWQGFEKLVANKCGQYGTILLGIDKDTKTGYLYAVGHANGAATVINSLGKVSTAFRDPVYFRWGALGALDPLNGD